MKESPGKQNILGELRVNDETRRTYGDKLSELYAEGYLDLQEFQARNDVIVAAKTRGELDAVFRDLPKPVKLPTMAMRKIPEKKQKISSAKLTVVMLMFALWMGMIVEFSTGNNRDGNTFLMILIVWGLLMPAVFPKKRK